MGFACAREKLKFADLKFVKFLPGFHSPCAVTFYLPAEFHVTVIFSNSAGRSRLPIRNTTYLRNEIQPQRPVKQLRCYSRYQHIYIIVTLIEAM